MRPAVTNKEDYALGLLTEECGELLVEIGRARRFGDLDSPMHPENPSYTARSHLQFEIADLLAAINYAMSRGLVDRKFVVGQAKWKLKKLNDRSAKDNHGRRLAP